MKSRRQRFPGLAVAEARFAAMRKRPPELLAAFVEAFACGTDDGGTRGDLASLARAGRAAVERAEAFAAGQAEPPYHDRHHFAEVLLAMGWLMASARQGQLINRRDAAIGVVAMAAHDLCHDGSNAPDGALEAIAAAEAMTLARAAGVCEADAATIAYVIEGTAPSTTDANTKRSRGLATTGSHGLAGDWLRCLAHEAEILPSLLPRLGPTLAELLATERRRAGAPDADAVSSVAGRVGFLRLQRWFTPAAVALGLDTLTAAQLAALCFAERGLAGLVNGEAI